MIFESRACSLGLAKKLEELGVEKESFYLVWYGLRASGREIRPP